MPRVARFKIAAIAELHRQLEYAPAETRLRQMNAAERLIADINPEQNYPEDFIIYRITGYRPDRNDEPFTFVGQALLPDLVNLVQTLSEKLNLPSDQGDRKVLPISDVARRLQISTKSIQRYRKQGLVCHYFVFPSGVMKLGCYEDALQRFIANNAPQLKKAAGFTRMGEAVEDELIEHARLLCAAETLSLNQVARRLADRTGRAHETIRMLLRRHDRRAAASPEHGPPLFSDPGPLTDRQVIFIHRAWQRGLEPSAIAVRFAKTKPTIHRAINRRRADLLGALDLPFIKLPTFDLPDAASVILSAPPARTDLNPPREHDLFQFIQNSRAGPPDEDENSDEDTEHALVAAYNFLKMRASAAIAQFGEYPTARFLDNIETDVRWADLLRHRLLLLGLPTALGRIEHNLHQSLQTLATDEVVALFEVARQVVGRALNELDPARRGGRQRLDRLVAFAMDKALAKIILPQTGRAAARHAAGSIHTDTLLDSPASPIAWLKLRPDLRRHVRRLEEPMQRAVCLRYGLDGTAPRTAHGIALDLRIKPLGATRLLQRATRALRAMARA